MARIIRRGEVRWYTFHPPNKRRPVVILTRDSALEFLNEVTIAPITSTVRDIPSEVLLTEQDGMPRMCAVNADHIQTVAKSKVGARITRLGAQKMEELQQALKFALGFR